MHSLWIKVTIESTSGAGVALCFLMWFSPAHASFSFYFFTKFFRSLCQDGFALIQDVGGEICSCHLLWVLVSPVSGFGLPSLHLALLLP